MMAQAKSRAARGASPTLRQYSSAEVPAPEFRQFGLVVRDMLIERGYVTKIGNPDWMRFSHELQGVSYESLRKAVTGEREPGLKIMEACADALGVKPCLFYEHQLAQARAMFDPSEVGAEQAYANLISWLENNKE